MRPPEDIDWFIHRVLVSKHYKIMPSEQEQLTVEDLFDMHCVLDTIEALESFANVGG